jgi:hypothetical protein
VYAKFFICVIILIGDNMNKYDNKLNIVVFAVVLGVVLCLLKDFISIRSYGGHVGGTNEKFYSGIILDGYRCVQYSTIQVKFKWVNFDCELNPNSSVLTIVDKTKELDSYICDDGAEEFYRDNFYKYTFGCNKSEYVVVRYENGYTESVKIALKNKRIAIADLDTYKIEYNKELIK